jgi:hypothetical protein
MPAIKRARRDDPYGHMTVMASLENLAKIKAPTYRFPTRARRWDPNGHMVVQDMLWDFRDKKLGLNTNPFPKRARRDDPNGHMVVQDMVEYLSGRL